MDALEGDEGSKLDNKKALQRLKLLKKDLQTELGNQKKNYTPFKKFKNKETKSKKK